MEERRDTNRVLGGNMMIPLGRHRCRWRIILIWIFL